MSSSPATHQDTAWYRLVRCLVLLYVASLDRKIARMLARLDTLEYLSPAYMALNDTCYFYEDIRDAYAAWLVDPSSPLPRQYDPNVRRRARWRTPPRPRHAGPRPHASAIHAPNPGYAPPTYARCTTTRAAPRCAPSSLA